MSDDKIKTLPVRMKDHGKVLDVANSFAGCKHVRAIVDPNLAELTCADCGAKLNPIQFLVKLAGHEIQWGWQRKAIAEARAELDARKRCRCTKCGEWTEIRTVHNRELARIKRASNQPEQSL